MALINCPECNKLISDKAQICLGCGAPVEIPPAAIVNDFATGSIKIGNLEIMPNDIHPVLGMSWNNAKEACEALGDGWRLPSKDELNILYRNRDKIGGLTGFNYWSSTEVSTGLAWYQNLTLGTQSSNYGYHTYSVRAVRSF